MLLAPNGKQSNLTDSQYKLVRTPAFKKWFGDWENNPSEASKVVDENGEPLVLYRGNKGNVEELGYEFNLGQNFLNKKSNNNFGFFFTDDIKVAKSYGNPLWNFKFETPPYYVLNVFIDVKNIIDLRSLGFRTIGIDFIELLDKKNISFKGYENLKQEIIKYDRTYDTIDVKEWYTPNVYDFFDVFPKLKEVFINNKINGVVFKEKSRTSKGEITYAVFNSNQIKLADGTNTTFDSNNNDIRFDEGGGIEDLKLIKTIKAISTSSIYEEYNYKGIMFKVRYADHNESLLYGDFDLGFNITQYKEDNKDIILQNAKIKFDSIIFLIYGVNKNVLGYDEVVRIGGYVYLRNFVEKKYHFNDSGIGNREVIRVEGDYRIAMGVEEKVLYAKEFHRLFRNVVFIDSNNNDIRFDNGGQVQDLISQGVVELKIFDTKPEHAKEYGLDSVNPLYVQSLCITENQRLKGIGNKVLQYIDDYAIKNGHDLVFGHITQNAEFTKDNRETFFCDTDMIKNWLHSKGYAIQTHNNDFHKVINNDIRYKKGGMTNKSFVSYKDKYNTKYGYSKGESHDLEEISKDTGVSMKGLQQIYNKGIGAYKTNPSSVRPNVKSKEQWAMARVYSSVMGGKASKIDSNELKMAKGGKLNRGGDCYFIAGQFVLNNDFINKIDFIGTPYLVHAEVQGQGAISHLRYGHAFIEDNVFVYDYSNNREIQLPKDYYYKIADIKTNNPKKYRKYTFKQAKEKMLETSKYGCWDLEVDYAKGGNIKNNNMSKYKDGLFVGKSHKEGGIPLVVKSTGQNIEVEGGEIITNKKSVADTKIRTLTGTNCDIISQINEQNGNGVAIDCDSVVGQKYEYGDGGKISKQKQNIKNQNMNENINFKNFKVRKPKIFNPTNSLGLKRSEMPQIRKQFLPILFEKLDNERIGYENLSVDAESLKPSQNEINKDFAKTFDQEQLYEKNVIVSSDNYIIDGHHRWYYCLIEDLPVKITRIDLPIHEALNFIRQLDFIEVDEIAKKGMLINNQRSLFGEGGNIEVDKYSKDIPLSIYKGVIGDFDNDNISNADDLEPNVPSNIKLEEISLKDEITDIVKYRNLFIDVQQKVLNEIKKINTCGKIQCEIKTRIKTPYSIINKLRRRSLTDVKTLDKLDKKAKEFLKNKNLKGIDLYKGLTDVLGFMVIVEDFNFLNKLKAEVEAGNLGEVLEFEDFYKNDLNGYRAYHFLLSTQVKGTFIPYELQIRTMRVNELARITHTLYKKGLMNDKENDKIAKQIEIADKGNKVIAKIIDKKLENKDLLKKELTSAKKLALGDFITDGWLSSYKYKVQNNKNKLYNTILGFGENEKEARKDLYKKYKDFTILSINGTPIKFFEDKKIDRSKINLKDAHSTFEYAREMKKGGVIYRDLSLIEPRMLRNDSTNTNNNVNEIDIIKTGETFPFHHKQIMTSNDSYELLKDFWNLNNLNVVEESNIIFLDKQNKPVYIYRHSKGGIDSTTADIEVICAIAVKTLSKGVIISHNHPSTNKNVKPSPADIEISKKLKNALKLFDIVLIDHIIVASEDGYYSMADEGVFKYGGNVVDTTQGSPYMKYISDIGKTIFVTKNKKEALSRLNSLKDSNDDYDQLFAYELMQVPYKDTIIGDYNDYRILAKYKYASGGEVNSNCDCYECISYSETMLIDEAYTTKGNLFLVKLKGVFYLIYDGQIVLKSSELRYAKREFESYLFNDRLNPKKKFSKGGMITDAEYQSLEKIVPRRMLASIKETKESWERGDSDDVFEHYENLIEGYREIPKLYEQDEKGFNSVVYLHYFYGGSDWYITELDKKTNEAFGYAILNGDIQNSELGYMNLNEFADNIIDLDLYWSFKTLNEIFENEYPELVRGEIEYYKKDATITRLTNFELLIEKNDFKNQYEINKFIELMIDEKGVNVNNYTTTEQTYLLKYSGMGGLQKYGATGSGILWEYYTPKRVVDLMWGLAYKHRGTLGYDRVLENSVGIGNFVNACPLAVKQMDCYDISKYAIAICMIIYGKDERFNFINESFETLFFNGNTSVKDNVEPIYDLVIGNPPYSEYSGKYAGMGEKKYTKATNYIDYFIFRSLDLLKSGGILVYVLGSVKGMGQDNWIESKDNYTKEKIKEKADLIDAYRLGSGVFDYTDVDSDIIVLRKK